MKYQTEVSKMTEKLMDDLFYQKLAERYIVFSSFKLPIQNTPMKTKKKKAVVAKKKKVVKKKK